MWPSTTPGSKATMDPCIADLLSADNPWSIPRVPFSRWRVNATGSAAFIAPIRILEFHSSSLPAPINRALIIRDFASRVVFSPLGNHHFRRDETLTNVETNPTRCSSYSRDIPALFPYRGRNFASRCVRGTRGVKLALTSRGKDRTQHVFPTISTRLRESANVRLKSRRDTDSRMLFALR